MPLYYHAEAIMMSPYADASQQEGGRNIMQPYFQMSTNNYTATTALDPAVHLWKVLKAQLTHLSCEPTPTLQSFLIPGNFIPQFAGPVWVGSCGGDE